MPVRPPVRRPPRLSVPAASGRALPAQGLRPPARPDRPPRRGAGGEPQGVAERGGREHRDGSPGGCRRRRRSSSSASARPPRCRSTRAWGPRRCGGTAASSRPAARSSTPRSRSSASRPAPSTASSRSPAPSPADLAGSDALRAQHLAKAIQYRSLDRRVTW